MRVKKLLRPACSLAILGVLYWRYWRQVADAFAHLHWGLWLLGVLLYVLTQVVSSLRWQWLSRPLGFTRPLGHYFAFYFIGMFFNLVLPTSVGGDVVRAWYLDGGSGRRMSAFLSVFVERLSGLLVLLVVACVADLVCPVPLHPLVHLAVWGLAGGAVLGLVGLFVFGRLPWPFARFRTLHARLVRFHQQLHAALLLYLRRPRLLLVTTVLSLLVQAGNVVLVWLIAVALDAPVPFSFCWILMPVVALLTLLPISVNGMGVRELATMALLAPFGVGSGTATSLAFLWFAAQASAGLCGIGFYLFGRYPRFTKDKEAGIGGPDSAAEPGAELNGNAA
jgi:uncharacterized membrane protein YbhN (UPF0104 family)